MNKRQDDVALTDTDEVFARAAVKLSEAAGAEIGVMLPPGDGPLPSVPALKELVDHINRVVFPDFYDRRASCRSIRPSIIGVEIERIYSILCREIVNGQRYDLDSAARTALRFIDRLPEIKRLLYTDVRAIYDNDPAVDDFGEIILSYPAVRAMVNYRAAHELLSLGVSALPRILTELAHSATGIDIHPGAKIGEYFAIDHGTGVVIGQTCVIGNHVTIYQGVTLGARNFSLDAEGHPVNTPRHPIIEDNVTVYSNASILGRITVGRGSVIGGNVWLTNTVPPGSLVLQRRSAQASFTDGLGI